MDTNSRAAMIAYWGFGQLGRDLLARCLYGLRLSLALAFFGSLVGLAIGVGVGLVAGLACGVVDGLLMGLADVKLLVPFTLVALLVIALAGTSTEVLLMVLGLAYWAHFARLVRGHVIALRDMPYVEAARAVGASPMRVALRHMIPDLVCPVVVILLVALVAMLLGDHLRDRLDVQLRER